jgi:hypothetical protein
MVEGVGGVFEGELESKRGQGWRTGPDPPPELQTGTAEVLLHG